MPVEPVKASEISIARNIGKNIKQIIGAGEYVDLGSLLNNPQNNTGANQTLTINQGQLVLQPKQQNKKITTIGMWTDAFLIDTSIFLTIHVSRFQELLKYIQTIRLGVKRNAGFGWNSD